MSIHNTAEAISHMAADGYAPEQVYVVVYEILRQREALKEEVNTLRDLLAKSERSLQRAVTIVIEMGFE